MSPTKPKAPPAGLVVSEVKIGAVKPYPGNPRKNAAAVAKVAASIKAFGFRQPIVCDPQLVVIAGHTRLLAARELGRKTVPVHIARGLTPAQVRAYRLADNRTAQDATWDDDLLTEELRGLAALDFDLPLTGFSAEELAALLAPVAGLGDAGFAGLPSGDKSPFEQMTFILLAEQADTVREALEEAKAAGEFGDTGNDNGNGNALARLAELALGALRA